MAQGKIKRNGTKPGVLRGYPKPVRTGRRLQIHVFTKTPCSPELARDSGALMDVGKQRVPKRRRFSNGLSYRKPTK